MSKKLLKPFLILLVVTLCCVSMFALAACDDKNDNTPAQNTPEIPDHSVLFKFIPNNDGKSYMARFAPDLDPKNDYHQLVPAEIYIPSSYAGFPVTAFSIGGMNYLDDENLYRIKTIYIPESITGGLVFFALSPSALQFKLQGYYTESSNTSITTFTYDKDKKFNIDGKYYNTIDDYINASPYQEKYNNVFGAVRRGLILIPYEAK